MSESIRFECRSCKKVTDQIERIVADNLPPNVKVLQCKVCSKMSVCLLVAFSDAR
jgi:CRISPR/Cas system-associated exonuclease Cas4 (RecB family)